MRPMSQVISVLSGPTGWQVLDTFADPGNFVRGGGPGQSDKKSSDNVFFLVLSLFYGNQMVNFKEINHFSRFQRGSNIF